MVVCPPNFPRNTLPSTPPVACTLIVASLQVLLSPGSEDAVQLPTAHLTMPLSCSETLVALKDPFPLGPLHTVERSPDPLSDLVLILFMLYAVGC